MEIKHRRLSIDPADKGNIGICLNFYGKKKLEHFWSPSVPESYRYLTSWINCVEEVVIEMGNIYYLGCDCNADLQLFRESLVVFAENKGIKVKFCNVGYVAACWGSVNKELTQLGYRNQEEQKLGRKLEEDEWNAWIIDWIATNRPGLLTEEMEEKKFEYREGKCKLCRDREKYRTRNEKLDNFYNYGKASRINCNYQK